MGKRRALIAVLAGLAVFGAVSAFAATLGGISTATIGANNVAVAACDTDGISTTYTSAWDATDDRYEISQVTVSGVSDTCDGQTMKVALTDASGNQLDEGTLAIPASAATSFNVALTASVAATAASGVHVIIA